MYTSVSCMMRFNTTPYFHCTCSCLLPCLALDLPYFIFLPLPFLSHSLLSTSLLLLFSHTLSSLSPNSLVSYFSFLLPLILLPPHPSPSHPSPSSSFSLSSFSLLILLPLLLSPSHPSPSSSFLFSPTPH